MAVLPAVLLAAATACAQLPGTDEMAAAFRAVEPQARLAGLALQPGVLWRAALRERSPLVAGYSQGVCQMGFVAYSPGRDHRWLFPPLPPAQRAAWLAGLVQHELAHCAEQAGALVDAAAGAHAGAPAGAAAGTHPGAHAGPPASPAAHRPADAVLAATLVAGGRGTRWHEVLSDLAFALHVDQPLSDSGVQLVSLMASLRAEHGRQDPAHDSSAELQCYLQQRLHFTPDGPWLQRLQAWRQRCWSGRAGS